MAKWKPKHRRAAAHKAAQLAVYYLDFRLRHHGNSPTLEMIGAHFERSTTWASNYLRMAKEWGYLPEYTRPGLTYHLSVRILAEERDANGDLVKRFRVFGIPEYEDTVLSFKEKPLAIIARSKMIREAKVEWPNAR